MITALNHFDHTDIIAFARCDLCDESFNKDINYQLHLASHKATTTKGVEEAAASVSDAMSRRITPSASGRANIASRTPSVTAGEAVPTSRPPTAQRPTGTPMSCTVTSSRAHSPYTAAIESVSTAARAASRPARSPCRGFPGRWW